MLPLRLKVLAEVKQLSTEDSVGYISVQAILVENPGVTEMLFPVEVYPNPFVLQYLNPICFPSIETSN